jgi:hypothetical protein
VKVLLPDSDCHVSSAGLATDSDYYRVFRHIRLFFTIQRYTIPRAHRPHLNRFVC